MLFWKGLCGKKEGGLPSQLKERYLPDGAGISAADAKFMKE